MRLQASLRERREASSLMRADLTAGSRVESFGRRVRGPAEKPCSGLLGLRGNLLKVGLRRKAVPEHFYKTIVQLDDVQTVV